MFPYSSLTILIATESATNHRLTIEQYATFRHQSCLRRLYRKAVRVAKLSVSPES